jgi:ABC transporter substrate binding protein (PQQ-dependent alcohol dehydrogenase system)
MIKILATAFIVIYFSAISIVKAHAKEFVIGYLEGDWSFQEGWGEHPGDMKNLKEYSPHRPIDGARVGLRDAQFLGRSMKITYTLEKRFGKTPDDLFSEIQDLYSKLGVRVFVADIPAQILAEVGKKIEGMEILLFNISAYEDSLRGKLCSRNIMHILPSYSMLTDSLAQYLLHKKWTKVLVLEGQQQEDKEMVNAFIRSADRFRIDIAESRQFHLSQDPRKRDTNRPEQLTRRKSRVEQITRGKTDAYDVIFVADHHGEFGHSLSYRSVLPRPVIGSEGLSAKAWHWSYLRHGAPQVSSRFEKENMRRMQDNDWAGMVAIKAISEAVLRTKSENIVDIRKYLLKQDLKLDGFKRGGYSFRLWNNQLRQRILLATSNWTVAVPPLKQFLHEKNDLDTLGYDKPESQCKF